VAESKTDALVKSVETLVAEKLAVTAKEKGLIDALNAVLAKMGYRVVAATAVAKRRGRRGRPPGSGKRRRGPGRPAKGKSAPKRRGRPPKAKTE
jgi:colicin import membrane protein